MCHLAVKGGERHNPLTPFILKDVYISHCVQRGVKTSTASISFFFSLHGSSHKNLQICAVLAPVKKLMTKIESYVVSSKTLYLWIHLLLELVFCSSTKKTHDTTLKFSLEFYFLNMHKLIKFPFLVQCLLRFLK